MQRKLLVTIHLYLASFFAPLIILVGLTGGLYILGVKGSVERSDAAKIEQRTLLAPNEQSNAYIAGLLEEVGIEHSFDYIKAGPETITRPTSRTFYQFKQVGEDIVIVRNEPSTMNKLMELHKGHGPILFRYFEALCAIGLLFVMISGLYLGLQSPMLKKKTLLLSGSGLAVFALLALI